jgi:hypothetical protein
MASVLDSEISSKVELGCFNDDAKLFEPFHKIYLLDDFVSFYQKVVDIVDNQLIDHLDSIDKK